MTSHLSYVTEKMFHTDRGAESEIEIRKRANQTPIETKIKEWTIQLIKSFPDYRNGIQKIMNILMYVRDPFVQDTLKYAPTTLYFRAADNNHTNAVQYSFHQPTILFTPEFMKQTFAKRLTPSNIYLFLSQLLYHLTHAAQDARGVTVARIPLINTADGILYDLLSEIDSSMVAIRLLRELILPFHARLPAFLKNSALFYYLFYEKYVIENSIAQPDSSIEVTNMIYALEMTDFNSKQPFFKKWQEYYVGQTTAHLLNRSIGTLTSQNSPDSISMTLEPYFNNRFYELSDISEPIKNTHFHFLTKYVRIGEQLIHARKNVNNISYFQLYEMNLCLNNQLLNRQTHSKIKDYDAITLWNCIHKPYSKTLH